MLPQNKGKCSALLGLKEMKMMEVTVLKKSLSLRLLLLLRGNYKKPLIKLLPLAESAVLWLWRKYGCNLWQITPVKSGAESWHRRATHCVMYYYTVAFSHLVRLIWFCFLQAVWAANSRSLKHWEFVASVTARSNESPGKALLLLWLGKLSCLA